MASDPPTEHITGYFVRIKRGTSYVNVDIVTLSDDELDVLFASQPPERVVRWVKALAKWIRENVADSRKRDDDPGNAFG